jgi:cysteinyl-tRNA synthetase
MKGMVAKLHAGKPGRVVLAYVDIGEAESYRAYWQSDWKAPGKEGEKANPDFILTADPDGWSENYVVAFWDKRWQGVIVSELRKIMAAGFDGVYLDWVEAYDDEKAVAAAEHAGVEPARAMVDFIALIHAETRKTSAAALVIAQNAPYLLDTDKRYADVIDGIAFEDTWFRGKADSKWNSATAGDIANKYKDESSTEARIKQYASYQAAGKPVFTVDYCVKPENAAKVYAESSRLGFVPLVTRVSLERLTVTPPPIAVR